MIITMKLSTIISFIAAAVIATAAPILNDAHNSTAITPVAVPQWATPSPRPALARRGGENHMPGEPALVFFRNWNKQFGPTYWRLGDFRTFLAEQRCRVPKIEKGWMAPWVDRCPAIIWFAQWPPPEADQKIFDILGPLTLIDFPAPYFLDEHQNERRGEMHEPLAVVDELPEGSQEDLSAAVIAAFEKMAVDGRLESSLTTPKISSAVKVRANPVITEQQLTATITKLLSRYSDKMADKIAFDLEDPLWFKDSRIFPAPYAPLRKLLREYKTDNPAEAIARKLWVWPMDKLRILIKRYNGIVPYFEPWVSFHAAWRAILLNVQTSRAAQGKVVAREFDDKGRWVGDGSVTGPNPDMVREMEENQSPGICIGC